MHSIQSECSKSVRASAGQPPKAAALSINRGWLQVILKLVSVLFLNQTVHRKNLDEIYI